MKASSSVVHLIDWFDLLDISGRPCQRCIKRSIGHLCHDEPKHSNNSAQNKNRTTVPTTTTTAPGYMPLNSLGNGKRERQRMPWLDIFIMPLFRSWRQ